MYKIYVTRYMLRLPILIIDYISHIICNSEIRTFVYLSN